MSFSRQRRSTKRMFGGVVAGNACQSGSPFKIAASVSVTVSPSKTLFPVRHSYRMQPNAQMSARLSTALPLACSGLMYAAVPRITPGRVIASVSVGDCDESTSLRFVRQGFCQAEVQYLDLVSGSDHHIGRFQIPVDHSLFMRCFKRFGYLAAYSQGFFNRQAALCSAFAPAFHPRQAPGRGSVFLRPVRVRRSQRCWGD